MKHRTLILPLFAIALCATFPAFADTLFVTPTGADNRDGSNWANAFAGIQAAVDVADAAYAADGIYRDQMFFRRRINVERVEE